MLPNLDFLPPWAQVIVYVTLAISIGIVIVVTRLGFLWGKKTSPEKSDSTATVAAVIVDSGPLNNATDAINGLMVTLQQMVAVARGKVKSETALARTLENLIHTVENLSSSQNKLADLLGQYITDQREERAEKEFEEEVQKRMKEELDRMAREREQQ